jgi:hypothetical protein
VATYKIEQTDGVYVTVTVCFQGQEFRQQLIISDDNETLNQRLQEYSDQYEKDWLALQTDVSLRSF